MQDYVIAVLLLLLGLAMLIVEVFVPSGGMIMMGALVAIVGSLWYAWSAWYEASPQYWWTFLAMTTAAIPAALVGAFFLLQRTPLGRRVMLEAPTTDDVTPFSEEEKRLAKLIGRTAETLSILNPGGLVTVDGERIHCESEGVMIDSGTIVEIVGVQGNRVLVQLPQADSQVADPPSGEVLDFEFPGE